MAPETDATTGAVAREGAASLAGGSAEILTPRQRVLHAVDCYSLTWNRSSVRFWTGDAEYRLATRAERKAVDELVREGVIRRFMAAGYAYVERGGFERVPNKEALSVQA